MNNSHGSNQCSFCQQCSRSSLLTRCNQLCLTLMSIHLFFIISFDFFLSFYRLLSIGCATVLPMGVAPEAIAESFGYRLKKIDRPVPYISSRIICRLYSPLQWIYPLLMMQAPESKTRWTCASWHIFSYSLLSSLFFLYASFSLICWFLCTIYTVKTQKYTLGLAAPEAH
jgi:hypothetical protein